MFSWSFCDVELSFFDDELMFCNDELMFFDVRLIQVGFVGTFWFWKPYYSRPSTDFFTQRQKMNAQSLQRRRLNSAMVCVMAFCVPSNFYRSVASFWVLGCWNCFYFSLLCQNNGENEVVYEESFPEEKSDEENEDSSLLLRCGFVHTPPLQFFFGCCCFVPVGLVMRNWLSFLCGFLLRFNVGQPPPGGWAPGSRCGPVMDLLRCVV